MDNQRKGSDKEEKTERRQEKQERRQRDLIIKNARKFKRQTRREEN